MKTSLINEYFDEVYLINLKRRPDRLIRVLSGCNRLNIKVNIVEAIDGLDLQVLADYHKYEAQSIDLINGHPLEKALSKKMIQSPGAWAYLLTWKKIIEKSLDRNYDRILCFDDDVRFIDDFNKKFSSIVESIPETWKVLYLGASQHKWSDDIINMLSDNSLYYAPHETDGSFAIGLEASTFSHLINSINAMNCAFDSGPLRDICSLFGQDSYVAYPNLCIADVRESDIQENRDQHEISDTFRWNLAQYNLDVNCPLISVIMPVYNAESTITHSLNSLISQSYDHIEILVVDDGSSDHTSEIVKSLSIEDARIKLLSYSDNKGCYYARNYGLQQAQGEVICIQDADDIAHVHRLAYQSSPIIAGRATFTLAKIIRTQDNIDQLSMDSWEHTLNQYRGHERIGYNTFCAHRSLMDQIGTFDEYKFAGDLAYIDKILYHLGNIDTADLALDTFKVLSNNKKLNRLYEQIDQVLLLSPQMTEQNISNTYSSMELYSLMSQWRNNLPIEKMPANNGDGPNRVKHAKLTVGATFSQDDNYHYPIKQNIGKTYKTVIIKGTTYKYAQPDYISGSGIKGIIGLIIKKLYNLSLDYSITLIPRMIKRIGLLLIMLGKDLKDVDRQVW